MSSLTGSMKKLQRKLERQRGESWLEDELWISGASPSARSLAHGSFRDGEDEEASTPRPLEARNERQKKYINLLQEKTIHILVAVGPAGTGKTLLATHAALRGLRTGHYQRIIITRPAVSVDEEHGFLPGTLEEKMDPWLQPIFDGFRRYCSTKELRRMMDQGVVEIVPLAYMRGRSLSNSFIIADEMQNATKSQFLMLLTRLGEGSRMIVTGDPQQQDRPVSGPRGQPYVSGLDDFLQRHERLRSQGRPMSGIRVFRFLCEDVVRHEAVKTVLRIYSDDEEKDSEVETARLSVTDTSVVGELEFLA